VFQNTGAQKQTTHANKSMHRQYATKTKHGCTAIKTQTSNYAVFIINLTIQNRNSH